VFGRCVHTGRKPESGGAEPIGNPASGRGGEENAKANSPGPPPVETPREGLVIPRLSCAEHREGGGGSHFTVASEKTKEASVGTETPSTSAGPAGTAVEHRGDSATPMFPSLGLGGRGETRVAAVTLGCPAATAVEKSPESPVQGGGGGDAAAPSLLEGGRRDDSPLTP